MSLQYVFCKHYQAMSNHDTCKIGVPYTKFSGLGFDERPCFAKPFEPPHPGCDLVELPTQEELEKRDVEISERFGRIGAARQTIIAHLGGPWTKKKPIGGSGVIDCPCCKGEKTLSFSRASYNGHIHARCSTAGCVSWME